MLRIFLAKDFYYIQSKGIATQPHSQIAHQISLVGPGDTLKWDGNEDVGAYFPSSIPHELSSQDVLHTFLLNPVHRGARKLSLCHNASCGFQPDDEIRKTLSGLRFESSDSPVLTRVLNELVSSLLIDDIQDEPLDARIAEAIDYIDDLETKRVAAGELAEQIALSESRFLHLFKSEMQLTVRKYLMWRRAVDCAILVVGGSSITEAAHATGFTDSAHFANVFKQNFGLSLSSALGQDSRPVLIVGE
jgi:AraC-like DNA-binding protein